MSDQEIIVLGGSGSPKLTQNICAYLGIQPARRDVIRFSDGAIFVRVGENVRGRNVYLVQSTIFPTNDNFMELLFWIDALKRASAESVTVIMPYFSYVKGDKKDQPRVSLRARVCADAIEVAGADRVITLDMLPPQLQGFFHIPVDNLYALPLFCEAIKRKQFEDLVIVSPDIGFAKQARKYATYLDAPLVIGNKERKGHDEKAEILDIIGDVCNKTAVIVDDFTVSGGTLVETAEKLLEQGAKAVYAAVTHGAFGQGSMERIMASPIQQLMITDSIETQPTPLCSKIEICSVAPLFGEAIRRIHDRSSISVLFPQ
ncbi:MAG: ribose-phosphate pyrophosphokinase [Caldilineaceae bacterium]